MDDGNYSRDKEKEKAYIPVHPELKIFSLPEFYSVPKQYLKDLSQDMAYYSNFLIALEAATADTTLSEKDVLFIVKTRIVDIWNKYLICLRSGESNRRIVCLRETHRKTMHAAFVIYTLFKAMNSNDPDEKIDMLVANRRISYIMTELEKLVENYDPNNIIMFDEWKKKFTLRVHQIQ
jgi:hypothetical protein